MDNYSRDEEDINQVERDRSRRGSVGCRDPRRRPSTPHPRYHHSPLNRACTHSRSVSRSRSRSPDPRGEVEFIAEVPRNIDNTLTQAERSLRLSRDQRLKYWSDMARSLENEIFRLRIDFHRIGTLSPDDLESYNDELRACSYKLDNIKTELKLLSDLNRCLRTEMNQN